MAVGDNKPVIPLLIVAGPTAAGKTAVSLDLAEALEGEIVSADSAQVYRGLDIGSAKLPPAERRGIAHHLIDIVDPDEAFSVADFKRHAEAAIAAIWQRGHLPIVVGGTGLFIRALLRGFEFPETAAPGPVRKHIEEVALRDGWEAVRRLVRVVDPASYRAIAANDHRRISRALEVFWTTGRRLAREPGSSPYRYAYWVLTRPLPELYQRIDARTQAMLAQGLEEEVMGLLAAGVAPDSQSLRAIGYRDMVDWYFGRSTVAERDALISRHTRQYAKRQLTWFRAETDARWLDLTNWGAERVLDQLIRSGRALYRQNT